MNGDGVVKVRKSSGWECIWYKMYALRAVAVGGEVYVICIRERREKRRGKGERGQPNQTGVDRDRAN